MATTYYSIDVHLEYPIQADRDTAYAVLKTAAQNQKATGKTSTITMAVSEYIKPVQSAEVI